VLQLRQTQRRWPAEINMPLPLCVSCEVQVKTLETSDGAPDFRLCMEERHLNDELRQMGLDAALTEALCMHSALQKLGYETDALFLRVADSELSVVLQVPGSAGFLHHDR
jgi:hypothetical protein